MDIADLWDLILAVLAFLAIFALSLRVQGLRQSMRSRSKSQWLIDLSGLFVQGWLVPLAKFFGLFALLHWAARGWQGALFVPSVISFALSFVLVDYLYYWNHRLMHKPAFWPLHRLHHSTESLDIFSSARNSLVTPLFIVYVWVHSFMTFVLADPFPYILGATLTSCLDLWRHSPGLDFGSGSTAALSKIFITPSDHSWHHSLAGINKNFGANFSLWDRIHGSYQPLNQRKAKFGWSERSSVWRQLFFPWHKRGVTTNE